MYLEPDGAREANVHIAPSPADMDKIRLVDISDLETTFLNLSALVLPQQELHKSTLRAFHRKTEADGEAHQI
jgi:hypothetical protein